MIPGGSSKEHKKKVDMDDRAESTSCNLAPWDKKLDIEVNLLSNLVTIGARSFIFGFVVPKGKPRYVKGRDAI
jgi:hypothetical protein